LKIKRTKFIITSNKGPSRYFATKFSFYQLRFSHVLVLVAFQEPQ